MTRRTPGADGRTYWGSRPDELAADCVEHAATHGFLLVLQSDTPVVPDEAFPFHRYDPVLTESTTWSEIQTFVRYLGDVGCGWVNLRFAIETNGTATVRYEAKPDGQPLPDGGIPACNGGFDCQRLMPLDEFERLHLRPSQAEM
jgi:hypothetical protein